MKNKKNKTSFFDKILNMLMPVSLVIILLWGIQVSSATNNSLKFAHVSDVHFSTIQENTSYRLLAESKELLSDTVNQINEEPNVAFTMFTGDQINTPYEKELMAFIPYANQLKMPWYAALGNHDVCVGGLLTKELYVNILNSHNKNFNFKHPYYAFTPKKGFRVIVLDNIIDSRITSNTELSQEQLTFLDKELCKNKNDVVLIFMHGPMVEPLYSSSHRMLNAGEMLNILKKYKNPIAVLTGHYHTTEIIQDGNILNISTPSLISYPNAFRIINVNVQRNKVIFDVYFKETRFKDVQKRAKMMVFASRVYYGAEEDRNGTYVIEKR